MGVPAPSPGHQLQGLGSWGNQDFSSFLSPGGSGTAQGWEYSELGVVLVPFYDLQIKNKLHMGMFKSLKT